MKNTMGPKMSNAGAERTIPMAEYREDMNQLLEKKKEEKVDNVNHPKHYEGSCSIECIDAMRFALGDQGLAYFCAGNVFKYLWRYKFKNGEEDLQKAKWYMVELSQLSYENDYNRDTDKIIMKLYDKVSKLYLTVTGKGRNAEFEKEHEDDRSV